MVKQGKKQNAKKGEKRNPLITKRDPGRYGRSGVVSYRPNPVDQGFLKACEGHVNPLSEAAIGIKVPDSNSAPSFTVRTISKADIYCDGTNRYQGEAIYPHAYQGQINYTTPAAATGAWTSGTLSSDAEYGSFTAAQGYRLVSWGVRIYCTCPYQSADGYLIIATKRGYAESIDNTNTNNPSAWLKYETVAIKDLDHVWVSEQRDSTLAMKYVVTSTASTVDIGWTGLCLQIVPAAGIGALAVTGCSFSIEVVRNYEMTPTVGNIAASMTTPAAEENSKVLSVANRVRAAIPKTVKHGEHKQTFLSSMGDAIGALAGDAVGWALPRVSNRLFGRMGARQPMAIDVD